MYIYPETMRRCQTNGTTGSSQLGPMAMATPTEATHLSIPGHIAGISYTFGNIFNNIVNPRFGN